MVQGRALLLAGSLEKAGHRRGHLGMGQIEAAGQAMKAVEHDEADLRRIAEYRAEGEACARRVKADIAWFLEGAGSVREIDDLMHNVWSADLNRFDKSTLIIFLQAVALVHSDLLAWAREE